VRATRRRRRRRDGIRGEINFSIGIDGVVDDVDVAGRSILVESGWRARGEVGGCAHSRCPPRERGREREREREREGEREREREKRVGVVS